uniref:TonB-dependent receptor n=1 Tax=Roseihalotalea indica TaxID=2867963 RepID=A0AA49JC94_9BACT|nr:TonB-dependent receptor [Tunicatimonas sp. TK19036]
MKNNYRSLVLPSVLICSGRWRSVMLLSGMMFLLQIIASTTLFAQDASGQSRIVSGVVTDETGETLPGVNIILQGTSTGTITDIDGQYSIETSGTEPVLIFSSVGYLRQTIPVGTQTTIDISMEPDITSLEEVVVVGYGTQKKESLTSAISNIESKEIQTTTHASLAQKIQGKVAGLQIRQNSGQPGEFNTMINIRGFGTPLFVIDGIARDGGSEFQRLNPEDIESISVLKDASAAIYGVRAANGVIIVTTKKGSAGKPEFSYNGVVGWQSPTDVPKMATAAQWAIMRNDAEIFGAGNPYYTQDELQKYIDGVPGYENTDWYDVTMKDRAMQYQHNLSASGGTEAVQYYVNLGYYNEKGLLKSDDMGYKKYTFRSNITSKLGENLKAEVFLAGRYDKREQPGENFFNIFKGTRVTLPIESPYANNNPDYPGVVSSGQNPLVLSQRDVTGYNEAVDKQFQSSIALTYTFPFVEGLSIKGLASYDANSYLNKNLFKGYNVYNYADGEYVSVKQRSGSENISNNWGDFNRLTFQAQLNYETKFLDKHGVSAALVFEQQQTANRSARLLRYYNFYTTDQVDFAGLNRQEAGGLEDESARLSYIGRFNYNYDERYLLEFAFRYDGSYRYHPDQRWGFFPVVSAGWRLSEEDFISQNLPIFSDLKLRASYGQVGEDAGNPFQYVQGFSTTGGGGYEFINGEYTTGAASPAIVNPNLTWFTSTITDLGLNVGLWDNRFTFEFDVYQRDREGLLAIRNLALPNTFGGTLPEENLNSDRVQGLDFSVGLNNRHNGFQYGVRGNFNFARTMNRYVERGPFVNSYDRWRNGTANRWNDVVWGYEYLGQFQSDEEIRNAPLQNGDLGNTRELPGDFRYQDVNNDGVINGNDQLPLFWAGTPKVHYGLTLLGSWKGFDFNILFQGSAKYTIRFNEVYAEVMAFRGNTPGYFFDRWHKEDPYNPDSEWIPGEWPATRLIANVGAMYAESSNWRRDASYVRLKSAELGYTLNPSYLNSIGIDRLRIYVNAFNLFTIADPFIKPFDPEKLEGLFNAGFTYPLSRNYNVGVNLTF